MFTLAEKSKEAKSKLDTSSATQKKIKEKPGIKLADNQPKNNTQRKLQETISTLAQRSQSRQAHAATSSRSISTQSIQMISYPSTRVKMIANWNPDQDPWPGTNGATGKWAGSGATKGTNVNPAASKLCSDVEQVTADLSNPQTMGHPHMAPKRMGGKGDVNNVRPWKQSFESVNWHKTLDDQVKNEFSKIKKGTTFYEDVETSENHTATDSWLKPLQDKHDSAESSTDKNNLNTYLIHLKNILKYVPDKACIKTPGGVYAASGSTFDDCPPVDMKKAASALSKFNGGNLNNLTTPKRSSTTKKKKAPDSLVKKAKAFALEDPKRTALASAAVLGVSAAAFTSFFWTGGITAGASALALYLHSKGYI